MQDNSTLSKLETNILSSDFYFKGVFRIHTEIPAMIVGNELEVNLKMVSLNLEEMALDSSNFKGEAQVDMLLLKIRRGNMDSEVRELVGYDGSRHLEDKWYSLDMRNMEQISQDKSNQEL